MRNTGFILLGAALLVTSVHIVSAQEAGPRRNKRAMTRQMEIMGIPDLTDAQEEAIKAKHLELEKALTPLKSEIKVKDAELKQLLVSGNPGQREIDRMIDEISALRVQMQKLQIRHHLDIRGLLTEEQRVVFDKRFLEGSRPGMKDGRPGMRTGRRTARFRGRGPSGNENEEIVEIKEDQ